MSPSRRLRLVTVWIAVWAILCGPLLSAHARSAAGDPWGSVCRGGGATSAASPSGNGAERPPALQAAHEHCIACVTAAPLLAPPPAVSAGVAVDRGPACLPDLDAPGPVCRWWWPRAPARAPPATG